MGPTFIREMRVSKYLDFGRLEVMPMKKNQTMVFIVYPFKDVVCLFDLGFGLFGCLAYLNGGKRHNP